MDAAALELTVRLCTPQVRRGPAKRERGDETATGALKLVCQERTEAIPTESLPHFFLT